MSNRYAIELHLVVVDEKGKTVGTIATRTTDDVTTDLSGLKRGLSNLREALGDVIYDHIEDQGTLTNRLTGRPTIPGAQKG